MSILSKPLHQEGSFEFESTGNDNVDKALEKVDNMDMNKLNQMLNGFMDLNMIFGGDCEELKDITKDNIENNSYIPNINKSVVIQSFC